MCAYQNSHHENSATDIEEHQLLMNSQEEPDLREKVNEMRKIIFTRRQTSCIHVRMLSYCSMRG